MTTLFDYTIINGMHLRNRIVCSATWEGMCDTKRRPTGKLIDCYRDLTKGRLRSPSRRGSHNSGWPTVSHITYA